MLGLTLLAIMFMPYALASCEYGYKSSKDDKVGCRTTDLWCISPHYITTIYIVKTVDSPIRTVTINRVKRPNTSNEPKYW